MIRSTKHILKFQTKSKTNVLDQLFVDFRQDLDYYIDLIINGKLPLSKFADLKAINGTITHSQWKQVVYKTASEIVRSQIKQANNRRYKTYKKLYYKCTKDNKHSSFTSKRFSELNLKPIYKSKYFTKPNLKNFSINVDSRLFDIQFGNHFDEFVRIKSPIFHESKKRAITICLPIKHHKHSRKFSDWTRKNTIRLTSKNGLMFLEFIYEKSDCPKVANGSVLGIDQGYKKLLSCSDGQILGQEMENLYKKISNKKQGSKAFKRLLTHRNNEINRICNSLDLYNVKELVLEDLKNLKHRTKLSTKFMNKMQRWTYPQVLSKLGSLAEMNGIHLTKVNPAYTSQTCSNCGCVDKESRQDESFKCLHCGFEIDADLNASINIARMGDYNLHRPTS